LPIQILAHRGWAVTAHRATANVSKAGIVRQEKKMQPDYAYPTMMAEKALKDLHEAMLENRYDDALLAGLNAIVDVRLALIAIKDAKERKQ
jgi:hypothetical protein